MALHTLIIKLHTLVKCADYQIDNMSVYAVYAKTQIYLCVAESLFRETTAGTLELSAFIEENVGVLKKANNAIFFHFMISILWKNSYLCQQITKRVWLSLNHPFVA